MSLDNLRGIRGKIPTDAFSSRIIRMIDERTKHKELLKKNVDRVRNELIEIGAQKIHILAQPMNTNSSRLHFVGEMHITGNFGEVTYHDEEIDREQRVIKAIGVLANDMRDFMIEEDYQQQGEPGEYLVGESVRGKFIFPKKRSNSLSNLEGNVDFQFNPVDFSDQIIRIGIIRTEFGVDRKLREETSAFLERYLERFGGLYSSTYFDEPALTLNLGQEDVS